MAEDQGKRKIKEPYKLVLLKAETLEEVGSYVLSPLNVYIVVSSVLVVTTLIVIALIFFTPLKRLVPGFADVRQNRAYMRLYNEINELESIVESQQLYIDRVRNIMVGDSVGATTLTQEELEAIASVYEATDAGYPPVQQAGFEPDIDYLYIVPPLTGSVSQTFDQETGHLGIDILAPANTPVKAILDGYVIASDWTLETGNTIGIQHSGRLVSFYKHNARNLKKLGSFVKAGEAVAIIGNTGELSSGPHLHFELWMDGKPVNPTQYIDFE